MFALVESQTIVSIPLFPTSINFLESASLWQRKRVLPYDDVLREQVLRIGASPICTYLSDPLC